MYLLNWQYLAERMFRSLQLKATVLFALGWLFLAVFSAPAIAQSRQETGQRQMMQMPRYFFARGYLTPEQLPDFLKLLAPVAAPGTPQDQADVALLRHWQQPDGSLRWQLAVADANITYSRFNEAFGSEISEAKTPLLYNLLDRVQSDISGPLGKAKSYYHRPRPFQRFAMEHVCGFAKPPAPQDNPTNGDSYPSGHTSYGWGTALVLAEVYPEQAQTILARGREYAESRMVCAVHFPTDLNAGQIVATAVFSRLSDAPEYKRDLSCAREEHNMLSGVKAQLSPECEAVKKQFLEQREKEHQSAAAPAPANQP
jgi:acid phosphatase (class A)